MLLCDLDGTTFNNLHRKHLIPADKTITANWTEFNNACDLDLPIMPVINLVKYLAKMHNNEITFATSRAEVSREKTQHQINKYFPQQKTTLHMRPMDEQRCSIAFKRDLFKQLLVSTTQHSIIIDDHPGIIEMAKCDFPHVNRLLVASFDCTVINSEYYTNTQNTKT